MTGRESDPVDGVELFEPDGGGVEPVEPSGVLSGVFPGVLPVFGNAFGNESSSVVQRILPWIVVRTGVTIMAAAGLLPVR